MIRSSLHGLRPSLFGLLLFLCYPVCSIWAQESEERESHEAHQEAHHYPHHSLSLLLSHINVREGVSDGSPRWLGLPSWGLDYNFIFHPHWAIGLHTDVTVERFLVKKHLHSGEEETIERSFPVAPAIVATWRPHHHWAMLLGPGMELAPEENFGLMRLGVEFSTPLANHNWEFLATAQYDFRFDAYDTFMLGFGIARLFGQHSEH